jgi:hypothetical protein
VPGVVSVAADVDGIGGRFAVGRTGGGQVPVNAGVAGAAGRRRQGAAARATHTWI